MDDDDETTPGEIAYDDIVFDVAFHPTHDVVAAGLITGAVHVHRYSAGQPCTQVFADSPSDKACRALLFSSDGAHMFSAGADKAMRMYDIASGKLISTVSNAHTHSINRISTIEDRYLASGDDEGVIKIWDLRANSMVWEYEECEDFISDFCYVPDQKVLLTTSGDGTLSVLNMRKLELTKRSDYMDEELLSAAVMKRGAKVVCGTQVCACVSSVKDGVLCIFNWGEWGDVSDRFPGHPASVDAVVPLTDDLFATGSSDGLIRVVQLHPNKLMGVIGEHQEFPIERMQLSRDRSYLASCSHDRTVKFWNVNSLTNDTGGGEDMESMSEDEDDDSDAAAPAIPKRGDDFFADL